MARPKTSIIAVLIVGIIVIFSGIFYISVLGENNRATVKAQQFFEDIKNNNYSNIEASYQAGNVSDGESLDELIRYHFALELSMLNHFNLLDKDDYNVQIKRQNMWFPFSDSNDLRLNVTFFEKDESDNFISNFKKSDLEPLKNILVYTREDGDWKLRKVNTENTPLESTFSKLFDSIDLNKYISTSESGFNINNTKINTAELSLFERRVLILNLKKALEILKKSS